MGKIVAFALTVVGIFILTVSRPISANANTWRMYSKLSSIAQDVRFVQEALSALLAPENLVLEADSVQIYETVVVGNPANFNPVLEVILETPAYGARTVFFDAALKDNPSRKWRGHIHLILVKTENDQPLTPLNSTARQLVSPAWGKSFYLMFATDIVPAAFSIDVLVGDLKLDPVKVASCDPLLAPSASSLKTTTKPDPKN